jgi:hypothetical protein
MRQPIRSEYTEGFDDGVSFLIDEIEKYIERREYEPRITLPLKNLLAHLKLEDKQQAREST